MLTHQSFTPHSETPPDQALSKAQSGETQNQNDRTHTPSKLSRLAKLTLNYWLVAVMLAVRLPQANAENVYACHSYWYLWGYIC
jgi:hypothetical protein